MAVVVFILISFLTMIDFDAPIVVATPSYIAPGESVKTTRDVWSRPIEFEPNPYRGTWNFPEGK